MDKPVGFFLPEENTMLKWKTCQQISSVLCLKQWLKQIHKKQDPTGDLKILKSNTLPNKLPWLKHSSELKLGFSQPKNCPQHSVVLLLTNYLSDQKEIPSHVLKTFICSIPLTPTETKGSHDNGDARSELSRSAVRDAPFWLFQLVSVTDLQSRQRETPKHKDAPCCTPDPGTGMLMISLG